MPVTTNRAGLLVILTTVFIDCAGIGLIMPILPQLIEEMIGGSLQQASLVYGGMITVYSLMNFVFSPVLGALSDRYGRRPVILLSLLGLAADYLILALAPNLWWLVIGRVLSGIFGATFTAASAYIADISPPERRAQNFGLMGVAFGVGFIAGPALGGILGELASRLPFFAAAGLTFVNVLVGIFVLPESLKTRHRRRFRLAEANPLGAMLAVTGYPAVGRLIAMFAFWHLAQRGLEATWVLYTGYRFGWGPAQVGLSLAAFGLFFAIVQGGLVRVVVPWLGEWRTLFYGLLVGGAGFVLYGVVPQGWMMYPAMLLHALGAGCAAPAAQALITRAVPPNKQGILQGALTSLMTGSGIVAPLVATALFAYFIGPDAPFTLPGAPYLLGALLYAVSIALVWGGRWRTQLRNAPAAGRT